ncbi:hypothetical protein ABCR94_38960 [Streptomyces sp. 21So2-11]|uniref:hypothetical protein n=1 Tax=Streptomyces sp. 21So2-11 TaxID=3144408 RepID=UPI00321B1F50
MALSSFAQIVGTLATFIAAVVVVLATHRTSAAKIWREEAEAQKERADRLSGDLTEIKNRLSRIEAENARLIQILISLDPARLAGFRMPDRSTED